jgi:Mg2+-importing ATPase
LANHGTPVAYWTETAAELCRRLGSGPIGLETAEAEHRLTVLKPTQRQILSRTSPVRLLMRQFQSPLVLLLIFAAVISGILADWTDALLILAIIFISACISFWREYASSRALEELAGRLKLKSQVLRSGMLVQIPNDQLVPGDLVILSSGRLVPADCVLLDCDDLFINQAVITGESFAIQKFPRPEGLPLGTQLAERSHCLYMGSSVRSGHGRALVVAIAQNTEYGKIAEHLRRPAPETEFDKGLRRFGALLLWIMLVMVLLVFAAHAYKGGANAESMMFAVALAVGLSPELLPAILTINLASSAQRMAGLGVLVRRLNAIENLGSMDILCTDKTGTITEGVIELEGAYDVHGQPSHAVLEAAAWNASFQTGMSNPLDDSILHAWEPQGSEAKLGEIPYDFVRKRLSVIISAADGPRMITKGAFEPMLACCIQSPEEAPRWQKLFLNWSAQGFRVLGVAEKKVLPKDRYDKDEESDLTFLGFLTFADHIKSGIESTMQDLRRLGVQIKIITGDNAAVSRQVAHSIGISQPRIMTADELDLLHGEALTKSAGSVDVFAQVDPNQKERIVLALKKRGHAVGYMGDGINDIAAMHAADTSISVEDAVDAAKASADFVLMEKDLGILRQGILEGRRSFANTMKYIQMTTSANLGNMFSMALASLTLPFLPLLAGQILLNNFLSDIPALGLAADAVDSEVTLKPLHWDLQRILRFMLVFGLLSSLFDIVTFGLLRFVFHTDVTEFRTAWFVESLMTELIVALVLRTQRRFYRSRPSSFLLFSTASVALVAFFIPSSPLASGLGFSPLPGRLLLLILIITVAYAWVTEIAKSLFYGKASRSILRSGIV